MRCTILSLRSGVEGDFFLVCIFSNLKSAEEEELHLFVGCRLETLLKSLINWFPLPSLKPAQMVLTLRHQQVNSSSYRRNAEIGPCVRCGGSGPIFATFKWMDGPPKKLQFYLDPRTLPRF